MKKLLLIDTFNFLHRAYHALPKTLTDKNGEPTNAIYGVTSMLINVLENIKPTYAVAALDGKKPTFRVEEFTGYKAHRKAMEDALSKQIPKVFDILDAFGIKQVLVDGYEADDVIGTLAKKFGKEDTEVIVVSNDRDLWQAINNHVIVMLPQSSGQAEWIGVNEVQARMGFLPEKFPDYKGLRGDPSDNIPGVFGVGEKTAKQLIEKYGTMENIYAHINEITPVTLKEKLANCAEQAVMSKRLATLITDVPVDVDLEKCKYNEFNKGQVRDVLEKYNFKSLIKRLGFESGGAFSGKGRKTVGNNPSDGQLPLL